MTNQAVAKAYDSLFKPPTVSCNNCGYIGEENQFKLSTDLIRSCPDCGSQDLVYELYDED